MTTVTDKGITGIVTGSAFAGHARHRPPGWDFAAGESIEDAEFETIERPRRRFEPRARGRLHGGKAMASGMGILTKGLPARPTRRPLAGSWLLIGMGLAASLAVAVWTGLPGVRANALWALQPDALRIEHVTTYVDPGMRDALFFDGVVRNAGDKALVAPPLVVAVVDGDRTVARYYLGTTGHRLAPHERFSFSGRLPVTNDQPRTVRVYFNEGGSGL